MIEDDPPAAEAAGVTSTSTSAAIRAIRAAGASQASARAPSPRRAPWVKGVLHVTRRSHLYAGLFLLPWVFLYGVTGFLFNHPLLFSDVRVISFGADELRGTPIEGAATPVAVASRVVDGINDRLGGSYRLIEPDRASLGRGGLSATVRDAEGKPYTVSVRPDGAGGTIREGAGRGGQGGGRGGQGGGPASGDNGRQRGPGPDSGGRGAAVEGPRREGRGDRPGGESAPADSRPRNVEDGGDGPGRGGRASAVGDRDGGPGGDAPFAIRGGLSLASSPIARLESALPTILERSGLPGAEVDDVRMASLSFLMEGGGAAWQVEYDAETGAVSGKRREEAAREAAGELSFRRYLLNLHKARGYPDEAVNVRSIWAVFVDAMSLIMVFWGVSGLVMWWQIKKTHRLGTATLAVSVALAGWIGFEMYRSMISG